ncbi:LysR family transcriptional regulator [Rhizobium herbae]|uniref:LysR family transcriptional regulator n=1 Tax=Rhizobium herbae TaxID=508661 RepID=A0ABS7H5Q8_9HYPH|nr:LysR family transcriptional regulator [Rhizobium herbae]MBW9062558.1 LysR family transcriptional regulator [Rhizobium herbae]
MDIATLSLVHAILEEKGIRRAAKAGNRPVSSVSAALKRFEAAIAVPLVRREGGILVPTLEAQSRMQDLAAANRAIQLLLSPAGPLNTVPSISLTALERFVSVARSGSIRGGAKTAGTGQPQLTRQMADLERDLGYDLLIRSPSGIACTAEGLAAMPIAESLLDIWQRLSRASGDRFRRTAATWRLGSVMPLGPESEIARMLAVLTAEWRRTHPRQPLFISSTTADELIAGLKSRRFDVVLLDLETFPAEFEGRLISRAPLALTGHASLFDRHGADLHALLQSNPIAVPSRKSGLRQQAEQFIGETLGVHERSRLAITEVDSIPVILNLVMNHGYLSVLPESSTARVRNAPAMRRLGSGYMQNLCLVWQKNALSRQAGEAMLATMLALDESEPADHAAIP